MEHEKRHVQDDDKVVAVNDILEYQIQDRNILHMILHQGASLTVHSCALCWFSADIKITTKESIISRILFPMWAGMLSVVENRNSTTQVVGLSQEECGPILPLAMPREGPNLWVNKDCYICSTGAIDVQSKSLPLKMDIHVASHPYILNTCFFLQTRNVIDTPTSTNTNINNNINNNTNSNFVFMQSSADILVKTLEAGETLFVSVNCLVALQDTVSISVDTSSDVSNNYSIVLMPPKFFKLVGPGTVWFTSLTTKRKMANASSHGSLRGTRTPSNFLITLSLQLVLISIMYYTMSQLVSKLTAVIAELEQF